MITYDIPKTRVEEKEPQQPEPQQPEREQSKPEGTIITTRPKRIRASSRTIQDY